MELLFRDDAYQRSCDAVVTQVDDDGIRLDRTVFYPTGGGQPGDSGTLTLGDGRCIAIETTRKGADHEDVVHVPTADQPVPSVGEPVTAEIDWDRRYRHMRMHTCLHLLCSIIEAPVTGGQVSETRSRLDFDWPDANLSKEEITEGLNRLVSENHAVQPRWITDDELAQQPDLVRTMSVKPPTGAGRVRLLDIDEVDLQPCGGTHVRNTGEIGGVEVAKIENKGRQNRRVSVVLLED
ncbi:MAG: alanyl-tRNA editing protein [Pseudomonadota bacterium]